MKRKLGIIFIFSFVFIACLASTASAYYCNSCSADRSGKTISGKCGTFCNICGYKVSSSPHQWSSSAQYVQIERYASGMHAKMCICGSNYQYSAYHSYSAATCTAAPKCTVCGYTSGSALGHSYSAATCTVASTCTRCGITSGSALGHNYTSKTVSSTYLQSNATCTAAATYYYKCSRCTAKGTSTYTSGSALGHDFSSKTVSSTYLQSNATCTAAATYYYKCSRCTAKGTSTYSSGAALGHTYSVATCTKPATCTICGATTGSALGHNYSAATCTAPGVCTRCGVSSGTALGHTYSQATCTLPAMCIRCGVTTGSALGHNYSEATCVEDSKCIRCGLIKSSALGHDYAYKYNATSHWKECTRCLDKIEISEHSLDSSNICSVCGYKSTSEDDGGNTDDPQKVEIEIEEWMRENMKLNKLAVQLRNASETIKANKNIYMLNEEVIYYIDYKNGDSDINNSVKIELRFPLAVEIVDAGGGSFSNNTLTWFFENGLQNGDGGTIKVVVKYTSLSKATATYKIIYPVVDIYNDVTTVDSSAVMNLIFKDEETEITEVHIPYMRGDANGYTFRPYDTMTRAEAAIVLTRVFGMDTSRVIVQNRFPDLNQTYLEAQQAIIAATSCGLINGYTDGTYRPNQAITAAEFMKILAVNLQQEAVASGQRGILVKDTNSGITIYKDPNKQYIVNGNIVEQHWALNHISLLARLNMTSLSDTKTDLQIDSYITRAEVAQLINFYLLRTPAKITVLTTSGFSDVSRTNALFADVVEATRSPHTYTLTVEGTEEAM